MGVIANYVDIQMQITLDVLIRENPQADYTVLMLNTVQLHGLVKNSVLDALSTTEAKYVALATGTKDAYGYVKF